MQNHIFQVLNFVRLSLESRKVNLLSVDRKSEEPGEENLQLLVDKTLREFTISVSGQKPKIEVQESLFFIFLFINYFFGGIFFIS